MNKVLLMGRLVFEPVVSKSSSDVSFLRNSIAVSTDEVNDDGTKRCVFINFVAFGGVANIICSYVKKGERLLIAGRLNAGSYNDSEGNRKNYTDVIVEEVKLI